MVGTDPIVEFEGQFLETVEFDKPHQYIFHFMIINKRSNNYWKMARYYSRCLLYPKRGI